MWVIANLLMPNEQDDEWWLSSFFHWKKDCELSAVADAGDDAMKNWNWLYKYKVASAWNIRGLARDDDKIKIKNVVT